LEVFAHDRFKNFIKSIFLGQYGDPFILHLPQGDPPGVVVDPPEYTIFVREDRVLNPADPKNNLIAKLDYTGRYCTYWVTFLLRARISMFNVAGRKIPEFRSIFVEIAKNHVVKTIYFLAFSFHFPGILYIEF
jgi:hypothetical protein